jgi:hypothetical protein
MLSAPLLCLVRARCVNRDKAPAAGKPDNDHNRDNSQE